MDFIELVCISSKHTKFTKDGKDVEFYTLFFAMPDGDVAKLNSGVSCAAGDVVKLVPGVKDGFLTLKIPRVEE